MTSLVTAIGSGWTWVLGGLVLCGLELVAPGAFLIWLGLAAILTGILDAWLGLPWQGQALTFAVLAAASVALGRFVTRGPRDRDDARALNRRGHALVGQVFTLDAAIAGGHGRVRVGDSSWRVAGPDRPAGDRVRVVGLDGTTLVVEPAGEGA